MDGDYSREIKQAVNSQKVTTALPFYCVSHKMEMLGAGTSLVDGASSLEEVRQIVAFWIEEYNGVRPHEALQGFTPYQFATLNP